MNITFSLQNYLHVLCSYVSLHGDFSKKPWDELEDNTEYSNVTVQTAFLIMARCSHECA